MASWMVHFRIAEKLMRYIPDIEEIPYAVGSIGPDCGEPNEDWSSFSPSSEVTHWAPNGKKDKCNYEKFFNTFLISKDDKDKWSFYLGYYIHLMTDVLWSQKIGKPTVEKWKKEFTNDKNFIWVVKKDWYDLDHLYLQENPEFHMFRVFSNIIEFNNKYLDYYSNQAFIKQVEYISEFYLSNHENLDREYSYLTEDEMDGFVHEATKVILKELKTKLSFQ